MNRFRKFASDAVLRARTGGICHALSLRSHRVSRNLPSLFVVSLPRSFSSYTYLLARAALLLRDPAFTTFGEVLNFQRYPDCESTDENVRGWFARPELEPATFDRNAALLDRLVEPRGFAYKDVVHPFVVSEWLRARKSFRVLRIRRSLADVAITMLRLNWVYPNKAAACTEDVESSVMEGLVRADHVLSTLPAATVDYDDLIRDGAALSAALSGLYPECKVPAIRYRNPRIESELTKTLARRELPQYREIERKIRDLRASLPAEASGASAGTDRPIAPTEDRQNPRSYSPPVR